VKSLDRFPTLFPKEVAMSSSDTEATNKITIASLFKDEEAEKGKEQTDQILPIYEPLEHRFNKYLAPDIEGKGKLPKAHTFFPDSHKEWNIDNMSIGQIR